MTESHQQKAAIIGEIHPDSSDPAAVKSLITKYHAIFAGLAEMGFADAAIEIPPQFQGDISEAVELYKEMSREELLEELGRESPPMTTDEAKIILAAAYGFELHAVDVGLREDIDVHRFIAPIMQEYMRNGGELTFEKFYESLSDEQRVHIDKMASREIDGAELLNIVKRISDGGGIEAALDRRVINGDKLIANEIMERVGDRSFLVIMGESHGTLVNEDENGYTEIDLEGALRLILGVENVAHATTSFPQSDTPDPAEAVITNEVTVEFINEAPPEIPVDVREIACANHNLPCKP